MKNMKHWVVKKQVASGLKWMTTTDIVARLFQFGVSIVLARLLGPRVFGVFGICLIFLRLAGAIGDVGLGTLLIQREDVTARMVNSALTVALLFSTFLCIGLYSSAWYLERYFQYENLKHVLRAFSCTLVLEGFNTVLRSIFVRDMRFSSMAVVQLLSLVAGGSVSIILAANSLGAWSLVAGLYVEGILQAIFLVVLCDRKIRASMDLTLTKTDVYFAFRIIITRATYFLNSSLSPLLIGRFLGEQTLGLYVVAYGVTDIPVQRISKNIGTLSLATLSKFQHDAYEFGNTYLTITRYFSLVILALFVGLFVVSEDYVVRFYGVQWIGMVVPLQVLCFVGIFRSFLVISSASLVALGKIGTELTISMSQSLLILAFVSVLLRFGLGGACLGLVLAHGIGYLATQIVIISGLKGIWTEWLANVYRAAAPAATMIVTWLLLKFLLKGNVAGLTFLVINVLSCAAVFILTATLMDRTLISQIKGFLTTKL
jgi:O-antigen/teichoic acid export membrane protein